MKISHFLNHIFFQKNVFIFLTLAIFLGGMLRFYDLNWGSPYYFHPDERNIASSISQLTLQNTNPHFFAYGSLPIYLIFFKGLFLNYFTECSFHIPNCVVHFEQAIIIGRIISAFLSVLLIPLTYILGVKIGGKKVGLWASILTTFSVGLIQYAHFGTFEMWTTFFATLQVLFAIMYVQNKSKSVLFFLFLCTGILISTKISNIVLLFIPFVTLLSQSYIARNKSKRIFLMSVFKQMSIFIFFCVLIAGFFIITNPYTFIASDDFLNSMTYESSVAIGTLDVFYTGEFYDTVPILFQGIKVFPFLLNPFVLVAGIIAVFYTAYLMIHKKSPSLFLLLLSFLILYCSQVFLYVKWVRYMVPTLPLLYIMISLSFVTMYTRIKHNGAKKTSLQIAFTILLLSSIIFSYSFFHTTYIETDTRIHARDFAKETISSHESILSEVYDMGIVPFNEEYPSITLFNFYDLDSQGEQVRFDLENQLKNNGYIILPSQRLLATRLSHPDKFPIGKAFYQSLIEDRSSYTLIYQTPCSLFCQITYLTNPIDQFEGTANVFDRPHVMIFKIHE